ncbi:hypothetical protein B1992_00625 [Pseudoxanthomonas broegbernensis]|uniref:Uncharacterized protein n=1 Tax=Pseudoxanthomonas broegbernensis TaxID=83619 RepID=A0A7V8K8M2_9GAMM|nr:hypothetical protein [Pseudoxanthomonas broegbernensis]KAF1687977.1 hypothetical protein B1992_00625 [Pseudoxanthomonas broegbernensis]MBB6064991.1 hypothetical protein [Pseudoxanthomonas broegbernensis]
MIARPIVVVVIISLAACGAKPQLLRHYKATASEEQKTKAKDAGSSIDVSVFSLPAREAAQPPLITRLSDRGQAQLVASVADGSGKLAPAQLISALSGTRDGAPACGWANRLTHSRRLVLAVKGNLDKVADRIDRIETTIALNDPASASFESWDKFDAVYANFNFGSATFVQTDKLSIGRDETGTRNLPASAGSDVNLLKLGAETTDQLTESVAYASRRLALSGVLDAGTATVIQEGGPNLNLFGAASATVTLKLQAQPDTRIAYLVDTSQAMSDPAAAKTERCAALFPAQAKDVAATLSSKADLRLVFEGDSTVMEGDDTVFYKPHTTAEKTIVLVPANELKVQLFSLESCASSAKGNVCRPVVIEAPEARPQYEPLVFPTSESAEAFRSWLLRVARDKGPIQQVGWRAIGLGNIDSPGISLAEIRAMRLKPGWGNQPPPPPDKDPASEDGAQKKD